MFPPLLNYKLVFRRGAIPEKIQIQPPEDIRPGNSRDGDLLQSLFGHG